MSKNTRVINYGCTRVTSRNHYIFVLCFFVFYYYFFCLFTSEICRQLIVPDAWFTEMKWLVDSSIVTRRRLDVHFMQNAQGIYERQGQIPIIPCIDRGNPGSRGSLNWPHFFETGVKMHFDPAFHEVQACITRVKKLSYDWSIDRVWIGSMKLLYKLQITNISLLL